MLEFDRFIAQGYTRIEALGILRRHADRYDPEVLEALSSLVAHKTGEDEMEVPVHALTGRMVIADDVFTRDGVLLVSKGMRTTDSVQAHLARFFESGQIEGRIQPLYRR